MTFGEKIFIWEFFLIFLFELFLSFSYEGYTFEVTFTLHDVRCVKSHISTQGF